MDSFKETNKEIKKDLKNFFKTIKYIHNVSGKLYTVIFFDLIWCMIRYGITDNEYRIFEFYDVPYNLRSTYMTKRKYKYINRKYVDNDILKIVNNKDVFYEKFKKYISRKILNIDSLSFKEFEEFALESKYLLASNSKNFITSYKSYFVNDFRSPAFMADQIKKDKLVFVEKRIEQHKALNEIDDFIIISVCSLFRKKTNIITSTLKFRNEKGIISGFINPHTGSIKGNLRDEKGLKVTNKYDGKKIPMYDKVIKLVGELSKELEEVGQVEWNFAIGSRKVYLLGANVWDDYVFTQIKEYLNDKTGLMELYKKIV